MSIKWAGCAAWSAQGWTCSRSTKIQAADLGLAAYAKHPISALRRTDGSLKDECVLQIELSMSRTDDGWRTLEFLAWLLRDQTRGGKANQLRPFALPPVAGSDVQLGRTLTILIELFEADPGPEALLRQVASFADGLELFIDLYDGMLRGRGDGGLT